MINLLFYTSVLLLLFITMSFASARIQRLISPKIMIKLLIAVAVLVLIVSFIEKPDKLNDVFKIYIYLFLGMLILKFPNENTKFKTSLIWVGLYTFVIVFSFFILF